MPRRVGSGEIPQQNTSATDETPEVNPFNTMRNRESSSSERSPTDVGGHRPNEGAAEPPSAQQASAFTPPRHPRQPIQEYTGSQDMEATASSSQAESSRATPFEPRRPPSDPTSYSDDEAQQRALMPTYAAIEARPPVFASRPGDAGSVNITNFRTGETQTVATPSNGEVRAHNVNREIVSIALEMRRTLPGSEPGFIRRVPQEVIGNLHRQIRDIMAREGIQLAHQPIQTAIRFAEAAYRSGTVPDTGAPVDQLQTALRLVNADFTPEQAMTSVGSLDPRHFTALQTQQQENPTVRGRAQRENEAGIAAADARLQERLGKSETPDQVRVQPRRPRGEGDDPA